MQNDLAIRNLQTCRGSSGTPVFVGGFGRENPLDLTGSEYFDF
jgi:hypothetical protein